jgi:DNA adenine methylase
MTRSISPLRYPGGKACLYRTFVEILRTNNLSDRPYVEPYSGGCGLGLALLFNGFSARLHINDLDRSIWAFWQSALNRTDDLIELIEAVPVTIDEWHRQRDVQKRKHDADELELGFSTFFLNRTNRSGVIHSGGAIGGLDQRGAYKIDCRFNKANLIDRIRRIKKYSSRITLTNTDAEDLIINSSKRSVLYVDPPYFDKGDTLYVNHYKPLDHARVSKALRSINSPWILTYDDVDGVRILYRREQCYEIQIGYSAHIKRKGTELLFLSKGLAPPSMLRSVDHQPEAA